MRNNTYNCIAMAGVSLISLGCPALAQEVRSDTEHGDVASSDIVVTARRREESVQDVPLVVNAVTAESIEKLSIRDGSEIQALVPGLQLRTEASGIGSSGQLRGIQYDVNASAGPSVAFYLNDAPIEAGTVLQALFDIGQIEVLRGPQGTLRGTATPSGSITFTTKKPNLERAGMNLQGTLNDIGTYNLNGAINVPIIGDVLGIRVAGLTQESRANRVHSIDSDADLAEPYSRTNSGRVIATFKPTDWLKLEGMYQNVNHKSRLYDQYASFDLVDPTAPKSANVIRPKDRLSIQEGARTTRQSFEFFNWRGEVRYGGQALIYQGSEIVSDYFSKNSLDPANFLNNKEVYQDTNTHTNAGSHEVRLQSEDRVFGLLDYVVGFYSTHQLTKNTITVETPVLLPPFAGGGVVAVASTPILIDLRFRETSYFGNVTAHFGDATQVSVGLRQIENDQPARFIIIAGNSFPAGGGNDKKLVYTASIQHNFTRDLMVYASTGSSRRAGPSIVNTASTRQSARLQSFLNLESEDSKSYEIGLKSTWLDGRLIFNLSGYHQTFKNYPYKLSTPIYFSTTAFNGTSFVPSVGNSNQFAAGVPVTVNGVEAEIDWKVTPNFRFNLLASYSDGKIKNGSVPCNDLNGDGVPDVTTTAPTVAQLDAAYGTNYIGACKLSQRSSLQSPFSATAQAEYMHPLSDKMDVFARGLFTYSGSSQVEPTNSFDDLGAYGLLNLYAGLRDPEGAWELNFYAKNVFDTIKATRFDPPASTSYQELTFATPATVGKSFTSTYSVIQTTPPREFGVSLKFALGSR